MNGEAFTPELDVDAPLPKPAGFDLDAWLSGAMRPVKYAEVYGKAHLQAEIDELDAKLRRTSDGDERVEIAGHIEALRAEMSASLLRLKFTSIPADDVDKIEAEHKDDTVRRAEHIVAAQCIEPAGMTGDRMRRMREALGDGYWFATVLAAANQAQQGLGITVPFSSAASAALQR